MTEGGPPSTGSETAGRAPRYQAGGPWRRDEDDRLVRGLLDGLTMDELAEAHGRTVGAVSARLSSMAPEPSDPDEAGDPAGGSPVPRGRAKRVEWLREELLADPAYDWRARLTQALGASQRQWTAAEDARVTLAWETAERLEDVSIALDVEGHVVVRRLVQLGLADDVVEATDRCQCHPDSVAGVRRRMALKDRQTRVLVLVLLADDELQHVSLHANEADAEVLLARLIGDLRGRGRHTEARWTLAWRQVESDTAPTGKPRTGHVQLA
ncbi:hypothetical protein [Jannaschia sp. R86511]|uniref:hypothetical protein n=1 Tax=Jannaschia sp. R86511 TaxID=3093853 RepID=UPI0036D29892